MTAIEELKNVRLFNKETASSAIELYLNSKGRASANTRKNYVCWFSDYFSAVLGKSLNNIEWDDIKKITYQDNLMYQEYLLNKGNLAQSVNKKLSAIKTLFEELSRHDNDINLKIFNIRPLMVSDLSVNSYGSLSEKEINKLFEFSSKEYFKPKLQSLFFRVLFITAIRYKSILNMTADQIVYLDDAGTGKKVWAIQLRDKGKDETTAIPDELAQELLKHRLPNNKIFGITEKPLRRTLKKFLKYHKIDTSRNITLHSIKKSASDYAYANSGGDIASVAKFSHHRNIQTTFKYYLKKNDSLTKQLSYSLHQDKPDLGLLQGLSKVELIKLIKRSGDSTIRHLISLIEHKE